MINTKTPAKTNGSDVFSSKDINGPEYESLILKILEAKVLNCLCNGYSKKDTEQQISNALHKINQRFKERKKISITFYWIFCFYTFNRKIEPAITSISIKSPQSLVLNHPSAHDESDSSQLVPAKPLSENSIFPIISDNEISHINETATMPESNKDKNKSTKLKIFSKFWCSFVTSFYLKGSLKLNDNLHPTKKKSKV